MVVEASIDSARKAAKTLTHATTKPFVGRPSDDGIGSSAFTRDGRRWSR